MNALIRPIYDRVMSYAEHRHALRLLFVISFIESSVFPIPPDVMILPMVLAKRQKAWLIAGVATLGSVLGGLFGYALGYFFFLTLAEPILQFYGQMDSFDRFTARYDEWGAWIVAGAGFTPFPYKVITIASGVVGLSLPVFITASVLARAARFYILAALLWQFGPPIRTLVERFLPQLTLLFFLLLLGGFLAIKYVL